MSRAFQLLLQTRDAQGASMQALMLQLAKYPEMLTAATEGEAPHDVTFYLRELAAATA